MRVIIAAALLSAGVFIAAYVTVTPGTQGLLSFAGGIAMAIAVDQIIKCAAILALSTLKASLNKRWRR